MQQEILCLFHAISRHFTPHVISFQNMEIDAFLYLPGAEKLKNKV